MTDLVVQETTAIDKPNQLFDMQPKEMVAHAAEMANVLADIIEKKQLFTLIQGKKYVRVDGWQILGSLLGFLARERSVTELPDGGYEAYVELYSLRTGQIVGGASAICGIDERRWGSADKYARRSMACTRAVGKAYRISLGWIVGLAGYEATPAEEIPQEGIPKVVKAPQKSTPKAAGFNPENPDHAEYLEKILVEKKIESSRWPEIAKAIIGKSSGEASTYLGAL